MLDLIQKAEPGQLFLVVKHYARNNYFIQVTTTDAQGGLVPIKMLSVIFEDDAEQRDKADPAANNCFEKDAVYNMKGYLIKKLCFHDARDLDFVVNMIKKLRYKAYGSLLIAKYDKNFGLLHYDSFVPEPKKYLMVEMSPFGKAANCAIVDNLYPYIPETSLHIHSSSEALFEVIIGEEESHRKLYNDNGLSSYVIPLEMWNAAYNAVCSLNKVKKGKFIFIWDDGSFKQIDCVGF